MVGRGCKEGGGRVLCCAVLCCAVLCCAAAWRDEDRMRTRTKLRTGDEIEMRTETR